MELRVGTPYWLDVFAGRPPRFAPFRGRRHYDVVIIGGGVTGCAASYLFAKAGARVAVIERARLGRGSTAASTALVMQEPDSDFGPLAERYGRAAAWRIWTRSAAAVRDMRRTLRSIGAPAVAGRPSVYYASEDRALPKLRREFAMRRRAGVVCRWLDATAAEHALGFPAAGAILTPGNTEVDPYRSCLALVRAARHAGAHFFEHSAARRVSGLVSGVTIDLPAGTISADWAVIATGYATREFKPLVGHFKMFNTYVVATPRLPREVRREVGLDDVMVWDTGRPYHYMRWTHDGRLLFGGGDRPQAPRATRPGVLAQRTAQLWETLVEHYPVLGDLRPSYAWEGLFAVTPDGLPFIGPHRRYPRQLFALGYGGNGMTFGFLAARALVGMTQGEPDRDMALFGFGRQRR